MGMTSQKSLVSAVSSKTMHAKKNAYIKGKNWTGDDEQAFLNGVRIFGLDYSMICATVLKNKTIKACGAYVKKLDKLDPTLIDDALKAHKQGAMLNACKAELMLA